MSQQGHRKYRKFLAAAAAATALAGMGTQSKAVLVTYDMYATGVNGTAFDGNPIDDVNAVGPATVITTLNGGTQTGYKQVAGVTSNDFVTLDLYTTLANPVEVGRSTTRRDDAYWTANGSFLSGAGGLKGNIHGDVSGGSPSTDNNPSPFNNVAQSGFNYDLDSDGDLDVGSLTQNTAAQQAQSGSEFPWFVVSSGAIPIFGPSGNTSASLVQWVGTTTFTVDPNNLNTGSTTSVSYVMRVKTDGADNSAKRTQHFVINYNAYDIDGNGDGIVYRYAGTGTASNTTNAKTGSMGTDSTTVTGAFAFGGPVLISGAGDAATPEPAALGLLGLGAVAMLRRRAKKA